ncbi:MAG TPA: SDR family oxidoreductase [Tepidisphaeraceae bacterium]|jgi:NAD(P)-dependent dehydrogenase (short-subunit alcohol dehydrogenase family)
MATRGKNLLTMAMFGMGATWVVRRVIRSARAMDFRGKVVVITGGSRGLGLLLARRFAAEGAKVAICSRDEEELGRAREELSRVAEVHAERCDVCLEGDVQRFIRNVIGKFGGIDVLVNNAGTIMVGPMETMTEADFDEAMQTHFYGALYTILAALPSMRTRPEGRMVNISSIGGLVPVPHLLPYTASKFALTGFSLGLAEELRKDNIYVTTVCPGLMRTGSPRNALFKGKHRAEYTWFTLGDSIPGPSQSADRAAARIVESCRHGDVKLVTSLPAWAAAKAYALFPNVMTDVYAMVNYALPGVGGIGPRRARGYESESAVTRSPLTALTRAAAERNNEVPEPKP